MTPNSWCGAIENAFHFFLKCPQHAHQRADLKHTISQHIIISLCVLLFGEITLSTETNTIIFKVVHKYIWDSKRFKGLTMISNNVSLHFFLLFGEKP